MFSNSLGDSGNIKIVENEIKKTNNVENGKIAAVITQDNEVTLKTIKFDRNKVLLIPANQSFQTKEYEAGEIQVQGTLSGIIRKYN